MAPLLAAILTLSACTGGSHATKTTSSPTTTASTTNSASTPPATTLPPVTSATTTTTAPKPTATTTVPVDQIPPGNPTSWVPAGVATTAKYKESGDVVPRFTLDMFKKNEAGALSAMIFYFDALNWDAAVGASPSIIKLICPAACAQEIKHSRDRLIKQQHYQGGRYTEGVPTVRVATPDRHADWFGQFQVNVGAGKILDQRNQTVRTFAKAKTDLEVDAKFTGKRWTIVGVYFVQ